MYLAKVANNRVNYAWHKATLGPHVALPRHSASLPQALYTKI